MPRNGRLPRSRIFSCADFSGAERRAARKTLCRKRLTPLSPRAIIAKIQRIIHMMNKTFLLALISVSALPLFAELKQTQILKEDFESGAPKLKIGRHSGISSEKRETISGKASLVCLSLIHI